MRRAPRLPTALAERIRRLHPNIKRKVRAAVDLLAEDATTGKPLQDDLAGLWSLRIGKFRLIYRFTAEQIELVTFGPRERIYEETRRLISRTK
ncbi:MAG TPA: type II toxin-antitoxin system RelE/ParE family toxin [Burkholderiales bacterium]|nr:type II toxin-antitoxin system RelE/ParE family toxin [Burkholderiales bacterium]